MSGKGDRAFLALHDMYTVNRCCLHRLHGWVIWQLLTALLKTLHWLKIPQRIEYKVISLTYNTSILPTLLPTSAVHDPTTSFNPSLIHSNTTPPFCHLVT